MPHVGDLLAEMLVRYGVEYVFGMPGGQTTALHDGIAHRSPKIKHVLVRDERSAPYAADAYARLTGKPGICDVTVGPGTTKLPDGLVEALNASIPMIALVGELPLDWTSLRAKGVASQGMDQQAFLAPITKATFMVPSVAALPDLVRAAFRIATAPRPGPVALIIPHDVMDAEWDGDDAILTDDRAIRIPSLRYRPADEELDAAARLIRAAERPMIVAGGGVHGSDAAEAVTALTDRIRPLVVTSLSGKGSVPEDRDYVAGVLNPLGSAAAIELAKEADLVVWLGSKASQNTAMNWTLPTATQATITIDSDPLEHGRTFRPTVALCGDIRLTVEALAERLGDLKPRAAWLERVHAVKATNDARIAAEIASDQEPILPQRVMAGVAKRMTDADVVISDASWSAGWIASYIPARVPGRRFLYARGQGGLGYAIPAALGAGVLQRDKGARVITVSGDGGHSYAIGEAASLAQQGLPVVNIVLNNGTLGWLQMWQELFFTNLRQSVDLSFNGKPDYAAAANAMGLKGIQVRHPSQIDAALDEAFAYDGPSVVEVLIDPRATPIHSFRRRLAEPARKPVRPGTVYELRAWKISPDLPAPAAEAAPAKPAGKPAKAPRQPAPVK